MNPNDTDARYLLGVSLLREKAYKEALSHLLKVYPSRSNEADMNYNIGLAYAGAGELRKAFQHYKKVDEINGVGARDKYHIDLAFYSLGLAFQKEGNLDDALQAYQEAIQTNPDQSNAYCQKGEVLYQKNDYSNALENLTICRERLPERKGISRYISAIYQARGIEYLNQKSFTDARLELEKALSFDPENETTYYYMGYLEYLDGEYKKALSYLEKVKGTKREDMKKALASMLHNIGGAMQKNEDWEGAISSFSQAVAISTEDPELRFYLGYSYMKARDFDSAISSFKEALRLDPKHQRAAVNLAIASEIALKSHLENGADLLRNNSFEKALKEFDLALSIDPGNKKGIDGKGAAEKGIERLRKEAQERKEREIAFKLREGSRFITEGNYLEANKSFETVLSLDPSNQKAREEIKRSSELLRAEKDKHLAAGEISFAEGKYYSAYIEYNMVLGLDPEDKVASGRMEECLKRLSQQISPLLSEARVYEKADRLPEAIAAYNKILGIQPDNKEAMAGKARASDGLEKAFSEALSRGNRHAEAGELMSAAESFKRALELKPDNEKAMEGLRAISGKLKKVIETRLSDAASSLKAGRYAEAVADYKAVLSIDRENKDAASGLQNALRARDDLIEKRMAAGLKAYKEGNYSQAIAASGEVLQVDSSNADALRLQREARARIDELVVPWLRAGEEAYKKGDVEAAILSFKKVLNVDPGNREAKEYLGKIDTQKAKSAVEKEIERYYLKGIELYTNGRYKEALEAWNKVLELDPRHEKAILNIEKTKRKLEGIMETK